MTIFSRYVFRQAAGALLLILLSLAGIVWIAVALRELNVVTSDRQDALILLKMTTLALPNLLVMIAPFALLIGVVHTLNRLATDSELIVYTAGGGTNWCLARPLLVLALIVALAMSLVNHVAMPWSLQNLRDLVLQVRTDLLTQVIQPGRFSSPQKGLTFHIRDRNLNGELLGLIMHDIREDQSNSYLAERGIIVKQDGAAYLVMSNGHIVRRTAPKETPQIIAFEKYAIDLNTFEPETTTSGKIRARELYSSELRDPEIIAGARDRDRGRLVAEFHERFASVLYPFAFVLIALATIGGAQSTKQARGEKVVIALTAASSTRLVGLGLNNVVGVAPSAYLMLYAVPLIAIGFALVAMSRNARPRASESRIEKIIDNITPIIQRLARRRGTVKAET